MRAFARAPASSPITLNFSWIDQEIVLKDPETSWPTPWAYTFVPGKLLDPQPLMD